MSPLASSTSSRQPCGSGAAAAVEGAAAGATKPQVFELTGMTGSVMYMAPEVFNEAPYNEKVGGCEEEEGVRE